MAATVKAWHYDDCRRLSIDIEQIQFNELKRKLQNTFQIENEFTVKYTDSDGDLCTISGSEELEELVNSDLVKERKRTLRLKVIPRINSFSSGSIGATAAAAAAAAVAMGSTGHGGARSRPSILQHRRSSSDLSAGDPKTIFDGQQYTDCDMLEILRDISLFICARGMELHGERESALAELPPGASSWVSAGKNLITPATAQNFQRLNYTRAVRAKSPVTNGSDLLMGLDGHVYKWSVDITGQWLSDNGYDDCVQIFKDHDITGDILLDLSHDTLKDMGITSTGRRIRLLKMIAELRLHVADLTLQEAADEAQALENLHIN